MYVSEEMMREVERAYGAPRREVMQVEMDAREYALLLSSMKNGRAHDVTLYIFDTAGRIAVIRKHPYPPGLFRTPSGGIHPGETFEAGAAREAYEETGLQVRLKRYILRLDTRFKHGPDTVNWTSHVLTADCTGGRIEALDTREIAEARWNTWQELEVQRRRLLAAPSAGLRYRGRLDALAAEEIGKA